MDNLINKKKALCTTHLTTLYTALLSGDVKEVERIQQELTPEEECVACTFLLKTKGNAADALAIHLTKEGFIIANENNLSDNNNTIAATLWRFVLFTLITIVVFLSEYVIKQYFAKGGFKVISYHPFEIILLSIFALAVFLYVDDTFLE